MLSSRDVSIRDDPARLGEMEYSMIQPNLFIAGFAKCGTTSVAVHFSHHPEIAVPEVKELYHHIDDHSSMRSYHDKLSWAMNGKQLTDSRYVLDATPFYFCQEKAFRHCVRNSDTKVIFMIREPLSRLESSFRFFGEMYREYPDSSFEDFVTALLQHDKGEKFKSMMANDFFKELFDLELETGNYMMHIERWLSALGPSRVHVSSVERLKSDPVDVMRAVCNFLEIDDSIYDDYEFAVFMKSYNVRSRTIQRLLRKIGGEDFMEYNNLDTYQNPFHFIKPRTLRSFLGKLLRVVQDRENRYQLPIALSRELALHYESSNQELFDSFGIDYRA